MLKKLFVFILILLFLIVVDQEIKFIFVDGFKYQWNCISLVLEYNYGVAFSMLKFLEGNLKYIQIALLLSGMAYLLFKKDVFEMYYIPIAFLFAGGISNIMDRFIHGGVVDYVYWHCGFNFAIFNLADVLIDIAIVWIVILNYKNEKLANKTT